MYNLTKKTKIVTTIGPASDKKDILTKMIKRGANITRLNFSHGTYDEQLDKINVIREVEKELGLIIPIMLDTKGPEIRTGKFENGGVDINKDQIVRISMDDVLGTAERFSVSYKNLYDDVQVGDRIKIDDGKLQLEVIDKDTKAHEIIVKAINSHRISNRKGMNIPSRRLRLPALSEVDKKDIKFGIDHGIDMIAASFIRSKDDALDIRHYLETLGKGKLPLIAKIENDEGVNNIDEILEVVDGIMVARGDLGVDIPAEMVPIIQRRLITKCRILGKPVITATQMLDSMQTNPIPTRAEVSDVATAIDESSDAIMLSGETASGQYPVESVEAQRRIASTYEQFTDYTLMSQQAYQSSDKTRADAIANSVANTANLINAKLIFCFSESGASARRIAKARPKCPLIMVTISREAAVSVMLNYATYPFIVKQLPKLMEDMEAFTLIKARDLGVKPGESLIITGGIPTGTGGTNFLRIITMNEAKNV